MVFVERRRRAWEIATIPALLFWWMFGSDTHSLLLEVVSWFRFARKNVPTASSHLLPNRSCLLFSLCIAIIMITS